MPSAQPPQVSVVIPHAGSTAHLARCLGSLPSLREVIVILPETSGESMRLLERHGRAYAVRVPSLLSFSRATNLGAAKATGDLLLMLNDDAEVQDGAIERLATAFSTQPDLGAAGPLLLNLDGTVQASVYADPSWPTMAELVLQPFFRGGPLAERARYPYRLPPAGMSGPVWLSGAALMMRRSLFEDLGGLDEGYTHGLEDAALCREVRECGYRLALIEDARVVHEGGVSSYRSSADSERVSNALMGGTVGWLRYWRAYRGGRVSVALLWAAFVLFALIRIVVFGTAAAIPGGFGERYRPQRDAYRRYLRRLIRRSPGSLAA